jgi:hypothetical protein
LFLVLHGARIIANFHRLGEAKMRNWQMCDVDVTNSSPVSTQLRAQAASTIRVRRCGRQASRLRIRKWRRGAGRGGRRRAVRRWWVQN